MTCSQLEQVVHLVFEIELEALRSVEPLEKLCLAPVQLSLLVLQVLELLCHCFV